MKSNVWPWIIAAALATYVVLQFTGVVNSR
jgi:hypothetical protein